VENFDKIWTDLAPEDSPCGTPPGAQEFSAFQVRRFDFLPLLGSLLSMHALFQVDAC
jgi:hypothetical protein